ncbi:hypothetical protein [Hyalangium minutum]|uniref:Uncharacterized protein n=1 Tax=Hyalangium minutum TaxID=394096 RepID=A0A085WTZ6_9BACT|nr:hypothetical protein [Hyalangium minutum]KFE71159.1 hypothetical protein DB31_3289 [Hyalangium minutum]
MAAKKPVSVATDELMEEFQLTELESRLEMSATLGTEVSELDICCECINVPSLCEPNY